jgi:hypothetical protein
MKILILEIRLTMNKMMIIKILINKMMMIMMMTIMMMIKKMMKRKMKMNINSTNHSIRKINDNKFLLYNHCIFKIALNFIILFKYNCKIN